MPSGFKLASSKFPDFVKPIGFQQIWDFEEEYVDFLALKTAA